MLAVISANDRRHRDCAMVLEQESDLLLPSVILTELAYMVVRDVGRGAFIHFMRSVLSDEIKLIFPTPLHPPLNVPLSYLSNIVIVVLILSIVP